MEEIQVRGGKKLKGSVTIEGAKNAVLPLLAASLLADEGVTILQNVPILSDVHTMINLLKHLNVDVEFEEENNRVRVNARQGLHSEAPAAYFKKMRASIVVMGPLLSRCGRAIVHTPGGCTIGERPIDTHIKGFQALGAKIFQEKEYIEAFADELIGNNIYFDFPSVGATQNIMMAAVRAKGTTVIENSAREPEIVELANFINEMGGRIYGAGTSKIRIVGVESLVGVSHTIVQDRIEAGTFMIAAAMTEGNVLIKGAVPDHNQNLIVKLTEMGARIVKEVNGLRVIGPKVILPTEVQTMPYPGFPTDLQAQLTAIMSVANGTSVVQETVFENRLQHLDEMRQMKAQVKIDGNEAIIHGTRQLRGAMVYASDLRAAAALILAGLRGTGVTRVQNLQYLDRGYYKFHEKLQELGADISRTIQP